MVTKENKSSIIKEYDMLSHIPAAVDARVELKNFYNNIRPNDESENVLILIEDIGHLIRINGIVRTTKSTIHDIDDSINGVYCKCLVKPDTYDEFRTLYEDYDWVPEEWAGKVFQYIKDRDKGCWSN